MESAPLPVSIDEDDGRPVWDPRPGTPLVPGHLAWALLAVGHHRETWLTWSVGLWAPAVVKVLRPGWKGRWTEALGREVRALRRLVHPAFPRLLADGRQADLPHLVVEYLDGPALDQCTAEAAFPAEDVARLGVLLLGAVRALHATGSAHLDITPANVLLVDRRPRLIDLGTSRPLGRRLHRGEALGTEGFLAPELADAQGAEVTAAADVYGVGATLRAVLDPTDVGAQRIREHLEELTDPRPERRPTPDLAMAGLIRCAGSGPSRPWPRWADAELPRVPRRRRVSTAPRGLAG